MYDDFLEARNKARFATSSHSPRRAKGIDLVILFFCSSDRFAVMSVWMKPGEIELTVIPLLANSFARDLVKPYIADLDAE